MKALSASESLTISLRRSEKLSHLSFQCRVLGATMISAPPDICFRNFPHIALFFGESTYTSTFRLCTTQFHKTTTTHALRRLRTHTDDRRSIPKHSPHRARCTHARSLNTSWAVLGIAYVPGCFAFRQAFSSLFGVAISILK